MLAVFSSSRTQPDKFDEIKLGESRYSIMERGIALKSEKFGCSLEIQSYRFATPWLALSQDNYPKYINANRVDRADLLRRILVGNILSASKGLGYVAKEHIRLEVGQMRDEICLLKGTKVTGYGVSSPQPLPFRTSWGWASPSPEVTGRL